MWKNFLKIAYRNILRHKGYSFINIAGLAVGMACCILILLWVQDELSFDRYHENGKHIYRVCQEFPYHIHGENQAPITMAPMAPALMQEFPEVLSAVRFNDYDDVLITCGEKSYLEENIFFADPEVFDIFTLPLLQGNPETALTDPYSVILSEQIAAKYFGHENPIGKIIKYKDDREFTVTGVMRDMPRNSHFTIDFMMPFKTYGLLVGRPLTNWGISSYYTYLLLKEGADPQELESKFPNFIEKYSNSEHTKEDKFFLQPLLKIHLYSDMSIDLSLNGNIKMVYLFSTIAFLSLVIACINYTNLANARFIRRIREVGIRKVAGARRSQLVRQFLGESILCAFLALLLAIALVEMIVPSFSAFVERDLSFGAIENFKLMAGLFTLVLFTGLCGGIYPALSISARRPVSALYGRDHTGKSRNYIRNSLVVFQFTISIILIVSTLVIHSQLSYIRNKDAGYDKDQILIMEVLDRDARVQFDAIKTELRRNPNILAVSTSSSLPNRIEWMGRATWPGKPEDLDLHIYIAMVDYDFVDLYGIDIVEGRNFSREYPSDANGAFLLNEAAIEMLGWEQPVGREFIKWAHTSKDTALIVGVMRDFHMHSLHEKIEPLYFYLDPEQDSYYLSVKLGGGSIPETVAFIRDKIKEFSPKYPFEYHFFNEVFDREYKAERKMESMFRAFTLVALFLASLGLFGMASCTTEQRTKEIGIRKVLGATISNIVALLSREYAILILLSSVIAAPLAYYAMNRWLQNFAYRMDLGVWSFLAASVLALVIAFLTVSYQAFRAAVVNPVKSLRYE
jgi:putative ABC transport system permease protein